MKPPAKAQGKGIFLFRDIQEISSWRKEYISKATNSIQNRKEDRESTTECYLVQQYIDNPHLIAGKKYDLRLYVLVTSYSPLTIYIHRGGFARFLPSYLYQKMIFIPSMYI